MAETFAVQCVSGRWRPSTADLDQEFHVVLPGEIALRRAIQRAYGFDHVPSKDELMQLAERWRPYRSLAVGYLFASEYDGKP